MHPENYLLIYSANATIIMNNLGSWSPPYLKSCLFNPIAIIDIICIHKNFII